MQPSMSAVFHLNGRFSLVQTGKYGLIQFAMWVWIYYGTALLLGASLAFLIIRKMRRSQTVSLSDWFVRASMFANLVTLVIAVIALQMAIASYIDRRKSVERIKELQVVQANQESLGQALDKTSSPTTQRLGGLQQGIVATAIPPITQASARSSDPNNSTEGATPHSPFLSPSVMVVQVEATVRQADAFALAETLQQKKFSAFVVIPKIDHFYRVQVGPYADVRTAKIAQQQLERQGFEPIIKHGGA
jgi:hypothetical protein